MTPDDAWRRLTEYREKIDELDREIAACLQRRAELALRIGEVKLEAGLPVLETNREDQVIRNVAESSSGSLGAEALRRVFSCIMSEMRALQEALRVSHLTPD